MLAIAVVVGRDRARAEVGLLADVGVADVGQVGHLRAGADVGVLDLHERSGLRAFPQDRPGSQIRERADADALADLGLFDVRMDDRGLVEDSSIDDRAVRADRAARADRGHPVQARERSDHRVLSDLHRGIDHGRGRVDNRDPRQHVAVVDAPLGDRPDVGQRRAVVDAEHLGRIVELVRDHGSFVQAQDRQHVGEVQLPLGVVGTDLLERRQQRRAVERKQAGVDLADLKLERGRVARRLGLDHALHGPIGRAHNAPVTAGVIERHRRHRRGRPFALVRPREPAQRLGADQRHVAVDHDHRRAGVDLGRGRPDRIGRPAWLLLDGDVDVAVQCGREVALGPVDDDHLAGPGLARGGDGPFDHRPAAHGVQQLRRGGAHACALPRGKDYDNGRGHDEGIVRDRGVV